MSRRWPNLWPMRPVAGPFPLQIPNLGSRLRIRVRRFDSSRGHLQIPCKSYWIDEAAGRRKPGACTGGRTSARRSSALECEKQVQRSDERAARTHPSGTGAGAARPLCLSRSRQSRLGIGETRGRRLADRPRPAKHLRETEGGAEAPPSCYHQACDTISNLNATSFDQLSDGAATALVTVADKKGPLAAATATVTRTVAHQRAARASTAGGWRSGREVANCNRRTASADPVQHFGTFEVQCGSDVLELTEKPAMGSAQVVAINGEPTNAVTVLMGVIVTVEGVGVVEEFHKPISSNQDVTVCTQNPEPGVTVVTDSSSRRDRAAEKPERLRKGGGGLGSLGGARGNSMITFRG
jgi:hypothetical protein